MQRRRRPVRWRRWTRFIGRKSRWRLGSGWCARRPAFPATHEPDNDQYRHSHRYQNGQHSPNGLASLESVLEILGPGVLCRAGRWRRRRFHLRYRYQLDDSNGIGRRWRRRFDYRGRRGIGGSGGSSGWWRRRFAGGCRCGLGGGDGTGPRRRCEKVKAVQKSTNLRIFIRIAPREMISLERIESRPDRCGARDHGDRLSLHRRRAGALVAFDPLDGHEFSGKTLAEVKFGGSIKFHNRGLVPFADQCGAVLDENKDRAGVVRRAKGGDDSFLPGARGGIQPLIRRRDREVVVRVLLFPIGEGRCREGQVKQEGQQQCTKIVWFGFAPRASGDHSHCPVA